MGMRINTNVEAMNVLRNYSVTSDQFAKSIERLSSGLRVNRAADDPAGLIISETLRAQIASLQTAVNNSQDAVNLVKTAEAALDEVQSLLKGARTLAVHSANTGVIDANAALADQTQIRSILESINRISQQTQFGAKKLLDGSAGVAGSVVDSTNVAGIQLSGTFNGSAISSGNITLQRTQAAAKAAIAANAVYTSLSSTVPKGVVVINGVSVSSDGTDTLTSFVQKINAQSGVTGVTANISGVGPTLNVTLTHQSFGADFRIGLNDNSNLLLASGTTASSAVGTDAVYSVSVTTTNGSATAVSTVAFTGGRGANDSGLRLSDAWGNVILLTETGNGATTAFLGGVVSVGSVQFQVGANSGQTARVSIRNMHASQLGTTAVAGKSLMDIDLTNAGGPDEAIRIVDDAIAQVSKLRGDIGSFQRNVLESNVRSLNVARENLAATESTIRDADVAEEMTQFTKLQILQQSGLSVLAQANSSPQAVLNLFRQ